MILKIRDRLLGAHVHVDVFIGPDADHLAKSGELVFTVREWCAFGALLAYGAAHIGEDVGLIFGGIEAMKRAGS